MENNELYHHGTKGMQWGKRLYQNPDGSLTALGRARYSIKKSQAAAKRRATMNANRKVALAEKKKLAAQYEKEAKDLKKTSKPINTKKKASEMSDDELKKAIERARMEDTYRQLRPEETKKSSGFIKSLMGDVIAPAAKNAGKQFLEDAMKKYGNGLLKEAIDPNSIEGLRQTRDKLQLQKDIKELKNPTEKKNWADELKRQAYEKNEQDRARNKDYDDLAAKYKYEKEKAAYDDWKKSRETSTDTNTSSSNSSKTEVYDGPFDIIGNGTSRRNNSSSSRSSSASDDTFWSNDYKDMSSTSVSSISNMPVPSNTRNFIAGLLE